MRIMRKENYLIGMINKGVLAFQIPIWVPGAGPAVNMGADGRKNRLTLTKILEWTLIWCILQTMFDRNFCIRKDFIANPLVLRKRLRIVGIGMLLISPFLVIFMLVYLFLKHAEQLYNHPSMASSRRWSNLSKWVFREFNEVDHLFRLRINSSVVHASDYLKQFPSPIVSLVAKFITFVSGGFAAVLIIIAFLDESLLEGHIFGRNLFWYAAVFGTLTAISRAAVIDELQVLDPEGAMSLVVQHTHYMPKRWRVKENTDAVRMEFETMFQYTGMMLLEEVASIFLTPYLLIFVVPKRVNDIVQFISDFTVNVEGVGDVCSLSVFDFESHGNSKYGSPHNALCDRRSSQGKMEKSFLSFKNAYPTWEPNAQGKQFLANLHNFREHQIFQEAQGVYSATRARQLTQSWGGQGEIIPRFFSRDAPHNIRGVPRSGYNMGSLWSINPEQRGHPYLLDWYYMSPSPHAAADNPKHSAAPSEPAHGSREDGLPPAHGSREDGLPPYETRLDVEEDYHYKLSGKRQSYFEASTSSAVFRDEGYHHKLSGRQQSHFEASTSSAVFRDSVLQYRDLDPSEGGCTERYWDARPSPQVSDLQTSFPEPPSFNLPNRSLHSGADIWDRSLEEPEEDDGSNHSRNSSTLSRTRYMVDCDSVHLPFGDINGGDNISGDTRSNQFQWKHGMDHI